MTGGERQSGDKWTKIGDMSIGELEALIDDRVKVHAELEMENMNKRFDGLEALLKSAFPGGDPVEHKRYHDEAIEFMRERRMLWRSIREKTLTALLWAMIVAIGSAVWSTFRVKIGLPPGP